MVKKLLARADKPGSTPRATLFSFSLYRFFVFFLVSSFFNTIFSFGLFSFILTADPAGHALGSEYIF